MSSSKNSEGAGKSWRGEMVLLLGASGYVGRSFASELRRRGRCFIPLTRRAFDYTRFDFLFDYIRTMRPAFLVNAANYESLTWGTPGEGEREKMMAANAILPQMIARVCLMTKTPWGQVSSGVIYSGAKVMERGEPVVRERLDESKTLAHFNSRPESFHGFTELDEPNLSFKTACRDFYSGTKALAEESIRDIGHSYVWRLRMPFNERNEPCNWLWRAQRQGRLREGIHSLSHMEDCVKACLDLWENGAPYGAYNVANPGALTMGSVARMMARSLGVPVRAEMGDDESAPPGCILDCGKLSRAGVKLRPVEEALQDSLDRLRISEHTIRHWEDASKASSAVAH